MRFFTRTRRHEALDPSLDIRIVTEGEHIRVTVADRTMLFAGSTPDQFLRDYRSCINAICQSHLVFKPISHGDLTLQFDDREKSELARDIALHWIRYHLSVGNPVGVGQRELDHPQTWGIILKKAEEKYGSGAVGALTLAAHTVGATADEFARWRRVEDDRLENM